MKENEENDENRAPDEKEPTIKENKEEENKEDTKEEDKEEDNLNDKAESNNNPENGCIGMWNVIGWFIVYSWYDCCLKGKNVASKDVVFPFCKKSVKVLISSGSKHYSG